LVAHRPAPAPHYDRADKGRVPPPIFGQVDQAWQEKTIAGRGDYRADVATSVIPGWSVRK
jgi:hypothetical protein